MLSTPQDLFSIYSQVIFHLDYPQEFAATDDLWDCGIDELSGLIAQTDSELQPRKFFAECPKGLASRPIALIELFNLSVTKFKFQSLMAVVFSLESDRPLLISYLTFLFSLYD